MLKFNRLLGVFMCLFSSFKNGDGIRTKLLRGSIGSLIFKVGSIFLTLMITIVLARLLGAKEFGLYTYAYVLVMLVGIPTQAGLPSLVVREVAACQVTRQWGLMNGLLRRSFQFVSIISLAVILLAGMILWAFSDLFSQEQTATFLYAFALLPLAALGNIRGAALRGLRKVIYGQLPETILRPLFFLIMILVVWLAEYQYWLTASHAILMHVFAAVASFCIGAWWLNHFIPDESRGVQPEFETKRWLASVMPLSLIAGTEVIVKQTDIVMLGAFESMQEVGIYKVLAQSATVAILGLQAVSLVVAPYYARWYTSGDMDRLQRLVTLSCRASFTFSLLVVIAYALYHREILEIVFGQEYTRGATALMILAIGQLVNSTTGPLSILLNMTGHERYTAYGLTVAALLNIVLNSIFIPMWGMEGAALATVTSVFTWNVLLWRTAISKVGINSFIISSR